MRPNLIAVSLVFAALSAAAAPSAHAQVGACAHTDFLTQVALCDEVTEAQCQQYIGVWLGPGTTCANNVVHPYIYPNGGQVNISGATLFVDFFSFPAATNDYINVDNDFVQCSGLPFKQFADTNCDSYADGVDQLAPNWNCNAWNGHWLVQYRSVGSGNGLAEFVDYQLLGKLPNSIPSEKGIINRTVWANVGVKTLPCPESNCFPAPNTGDLNCDGAVNGLDVQALVTAIIDGQSAYEAAYPGCYYVRADYDENGLVELADVPGLVNCLLAGGCGLSESGTPVCPTSIDIANMDVATKWFVRAGTSSTAAWNQKPSVPGYGTNPNTSTTGYSNQLKTLSRTLPGGGSVTLNTNTANPDANTVYDTTIAYSPVAFIANRGTGLENVTYTELQYAFVTGRMPSGENLTVCTRDVGSGTRNAAMNSLGIDPSWGVGDNLGPKHDTDASSQLGVNTWPTNCGGSGVMETAVRYRRLGLGYTGLFGSSRAAGDAAAGQYEILNLKKDIAGGTQFVRPSVDAVLDNADVNTGWQIGGSQTLATRGDPESGFNGNTNPPMSNLAARDVIRNITASIAGFLANPTPGTPENFFMPAEIMVRDFVLDAGVDALPLLDDPSVYVPSTILNQAAQDAIRASQVTVVPPFGSVHPGTGQNVPKRIAGTYEDGSTNGNYLDWEGNYTISSSLKVMPRMRIQGDFNADGVRDVNDIPAMMAAVLNPRQFEVNDATGIVNYGCTTAGTTSDYIVPEILGDFNGDGNFNAADIRYFADGLAMSNGVLNRQLGFYLVDFHWNVLTGNANYFGTVRGDGQAYVMGDSVADVAGNAVSRGAMPSGADGVINAADVAYVTANQFSAAWGTNLDVHAVKDLSCDLNGDRVVDALDVTLVTDLAN